MKRGWEKVFLMVALLSVAACEEKTLPPGFERVGGKANVHFVHLDEAVYKGSHWSQMTASETLCELHQHTNNCDVYIWTDKSKVLTTLPMMQRGKEVGWFALRDGRPAYFKEANHEEPLFDTYGISDPGLRGARMKYYGGFADSDRD